MILNSGMGDKALASSVHSWYRVHADDSVPSD